MDNDDVILYCENHVNDQGVPASDMDLYLFNGFVAEKQIHDKDKARQYFKIIRNWLRSSRENWIKEDNDDR
jgi:hypothetical protein